MAYKFQSFGDVMSDIYVGLDDDQYVALSDFAKSLDTVELKGGYLKIKFHDPHYLYVLGEDGQYERLDIDTDIKINLTSESTMARVLLGDGDDVVKLGDGVPEDTFWLDGFANKVNAGEGDNRLIGGDRNDSLKSGYGNDTLKGGAGDDILYSRGGMDRLTGGEGDDIFSFICNEITATIIDFDAGEDFISIRTSSWSATVWDIEFDRKGQDVVLTLENEDSGKTLEITLADVGKITKDDIEFLLF